MPALARNGRWSDGTPKKSEEIKYTIYENNERDTQCSTRTQTLRYFSHRDCYHSRRQWVKITCEKSTAYARDCKPFFFGSNKFHVEAGTRYVSRVSSSRWWCAFRVRLAECSEQRNDKRTPNETQSMNKYTIYFFLFSCYARDSFFFFRALCFYFVIIVFGCNL